MKMLKSLYNRAGLLLVAFLLVLGSVSAHAQGYAIAATDGSGNVTFTPGVLVTALLVIVIATISAVGALVLLYKGARMVFRWLGTK